jgi:hypothetical protein
MNVLVTCTQLSVHLYVRVITDLPSTTYVGECIAQDKNKPTAHVAPLLILYYHIQDGENQRWE